MEKISFGFKGIHLEHASPRDLALISMLKLAVFFSPMAAGVAIGYSIYFLFGNGIIGGVLGVVITYLLYLHHKSLFYHLKGKVIAFILILSLIISGGLSLPLKFSREESEVISRMMIENEERFDQALIAWKNWTEEQNRERQRLNNTITQAAKSYDERGGRGIQQLRDARRELESFELNHKKREEETRAIFVKEAGYIIDFEPTTMEAFRYYVLQIKDGESTDKVMFLIAFFLFFIVEGSPGLIGWGLLGGSYARSLEREEEYRKMHERDLEKNLQTSEKISIEQHAEIDKVSENIDYVPTFLLRKEVFDSLRENIHSNFQKAAELLKKYHLYQSSKFGTMDSKTSAESEELATDEEDNQGESGDTDDNDDDVPMVTY